MLSVEVDLVPRLINEYIVSLFTENYFLLCFYDFFQYISKPVFSYFYSSKGIEWVLLLLPEYLFVQSIHTFTEVLLLLTLVHISFACAAARTLLHLALFDICGPSSQCAAARRRHRQEAAPFRSREALCLLLGLHYHTRERPARQTRSVQH